jgi:hypothetical protein
MIRSSSTRTASAFALLAALVTSAPAAAQNTPSPSNAQSTAADESMTAFGNRDKLCIEWTDECRHCVRSEADKIACSNIGIACQTKEIRCISRTNETTK